MFASILVNGLVLSGIYGMLALGFALTYGVARILNLAHTAFYMVSAYALFFFLGWVGFTGAALLVLLLALAAYALLLEPLKEHEATVLIVTIALALLLQEVVLLLFGGHFRSVPALLPGYLEVLGVRVAQQALVALGFAVWSCSSFGPSSAVRGSAWVSGPPPRIRRRRNSWASAFPGRGTGPWAWALFLRPWRAWPWPRWPPSSPTCGTRPFSWSWPQWSWADSGACQGPSWGAWSWRLPKSWW